MTCTCVFFPGRKRESETAVHDLIPPPQPLSPEYDEDSDEMSRKSRATMYDARTSGVWTGVSMPSFFSERVKPMDDELASLPLGQQLLQ